MTSEVELAALRNRIYELEAENHQLKTNTRFFSFQSLCSPMDALRELEVTQHHLTLHIAASWDAKIDPHTQQIHMIGRSGVGNNQFHYQYFMEDPRHLKQNDALMVMEHLHKRLIQCLAQHWVVDKQ